MRPLFGKGGLIYLLLLFGATTLISCKEKIEKTDALHATDSISTQTVHNMDLIETKYGRVHLRLQAPLMENYSLVAEPFEIFQRGLKVQGYTPEGVLETEITADRAIHQTTNSRERWEAYGNVVIVNHIKNETIQTDTLYWDRANQRIYTNSFVKMFSPQGLMQGYGMESDERAGNSWILRPFDSYGVVNNLDD